MQIWSSIFLQHPAFLQRNNEVNLVLDVFPPDFEYKKILSHRTSL